ncbi:hypothetical protein GGF50DRAFT_62462 [Schizophyllum commune]
MPPKRFVTQAKHRDAISCASSYAFNSGNKEAPWYGVQNRYLSDLLSPSMSLYPQYRLDLQSSLWQKRVKASSAPNSAAAPNPAAPSSTPPSIAAPPAAAEPRPSAPHSHAAGSPQPGDGPVDLHLDDNSDPDELDALTADTHFEDEDEDEDVIVDLEVAAAASDGCTDDSEDEDPEDASEDEDAGADVENEGDQQDVDAVVGDEQEHEEQRATQEDGANDLEVSEIAHAPPSASEPVPQGRELRSRANPAQAQEATASETDAPDPGQPANRTAHQYTSPFPDGRSDTSRKTLKDKKAISRYPDFAIAHTISAKISAAPVGGEDAALHAVKLEIHCGRKTLHRCLLLIEEDKRAPSRRTTGRARVREIDTQLAQAAVQLVEYVSAYFHAVPHSPGVIGRVTSGIYWKWLFITRREVPQYDPANKQTKADKVNQDLLDKLVAKYIEDTPTNNLGDKGSDLALDAMRKRFYELARDCKKTH